MSIFFRPWVETQPAEPDRTRVMLPLNDNNQVRLTQVLVLAVHEHGRIQKFQNGRGGGSHKSRVYVYSNYAHSVRESSTVLLKNTISKLIILDPPLMRTHGGPR